MTALNPTGLTSSDQAPLSGQEFLATLREQGARYWHTHPFHTRMHEGRLTRQQLQAWVANRHYYQKCIALKDAAIIANCPDGAVRRRWVARLVAQDGTGPGSGEIDEWLRLGLAVGLTLDDLATDAHVIAGVRFAADAYVAFARSRSWMEGVAASLSQDFASELLSVRSAAFERHYAWVDTAAVAPFGARKDRLARESDGARALLVEYCVTRDLQERARAALAFKAEVLWAMLDALDHAHHSSE